MLWQALRNRQLQGLKFRRQYPITPYIADFACVEHRLIVEIDGSYHDHVYAEDVNRQTQIEANGWKVVRFRNEEVLSDVEAVTVAILRSLEVAPSPQPLYLPLSSFL